MAGRLGELRVDVGGCGLAWQSEADRRLKVPAGATAVFTCILTVVLPVLRCERGYLIQSLSGLPDSCVHDFVCFSLFAMFELPKHVFIFQSLITST